MTFNECHSFLGLLKLVVGLPVVKICRAFFALKFANISCYLTGGLVLHALVMCWRWNRGARPWIVSWRWSVAAVSPLLTAALCYESRVSLTYDTMTGISPIGPNVFTSVWKQGQKFFNSHRRWYLFNRKCQEKPGSRSCKTLCLYSMHITQN